MTYTHLSISDSPSGVRTITLNRPEKFNALNDLLADEIPLAMGEAAKDDRIKVIVLTGSGKGFCAGLDLREPAGVTAMLAGTRDQKLDEFGWVGRQALAMVNCAKPIIAAINGPAAGAGLGLALAADIRLMSATARLTTGYTKIGLCPDAGVSYFLPRLIGQARATELIMTSRDIEASEAAQIGLVARVFSPENFLLEVTNYANDLAEGPPIALSYCKRLLHQSLETNLANQLRAEFSGIKICFNTLDSQNAIKAFSEKRQASFKGK